MSVERESAAINNTIILRNYFKFAQTSDYFTPYAISKVEILDSDGVTVLETITGAGIIADATGQYHVVASAVTSAKTIYDKWYFTPTLGATALTKTNTCIVWEYVGEQGVQDLIVGTNSFVTFQEAVSYFAGRLGSDPWDDATSSDKAKALITAYNQLTGCGKYSFPETISQDIKKAHCEMALFLLKHQVDMDSRLGLQAQGVTRADIVGETYELIKGIPIPVMILQMFKDYLVDSPLKAINLTRDENEDIG